MRTLPLALALGIAIGAGVACGGSKKAQAVEPSPAAEPPGVMEGGRPGERLTVPPGTAPKDEIALLDEDITSSFQRFGAAPPVVMSGTPPDPRPFAEIRGVCTPPRVPACADICTISDRICDSAERICILADQLAPDDWAAGRCASGKQSCTTAKQRCCDCR